MTILECDADWPKVLEHLPLIATEMLTEGANLGTGKITREVDMPIDQMVLNARASWMRRYGREPSDLIFGAKACVMLKRYIQSIPNNVWQREFQMNARPTNQFMGMTYHRDFDMEGFKIFGDL